MMDERAYIARVEAAGPEELTMLLARPSGEEERALRAYLGNERYVRMHALALRQGLARSRKETRGNVVVIHGIMGGELSTIDRKGSSGHLWVKVLRILGGGMRYLRLAANGLESYEPDTDVQATGIMKRHYGELLLSLSQEWNVRAFWFDWRKDLCIAAAQLEAHLNGWFAAGEPVHLVAHSMGGLVARSFIKSYPQRWAHMRDTNQSRRGGRLIMLGTPNHGSFAVPQIIVGLETLVRMLGMFDLRHDRTELLRIINTFVGSYQMLPSHLEMPRMEPLYRAETYGADLDVPQAYLDTARQHHEGLREVREPERMVYVAGVNQPTFCDIPDLQKLRDKKDYSITLDGDGRVPHTLGLLKGVKTFYVDEEHGSLPGNAHILSALGELMETGSTRLLHQSADAARATRAPPPSPTELRARVEEQEKKMLEEAQTYVRRMRMRSAVVQEPSYIMEDERQVEELLTRGFLSTSTRRAQPGAPSAASFAIPRIEVRVVCGNIGSTDELRSEDLPIDALAVGHYLGVNPQEAELALDKAISWEMDKRKVPGAEDENAAEDGLILTQYTERGTLRGELGRPFFLPDPRTPGQAGKPSRVIAIAGMGVPGRFGVPELTILSRELSWALGRMGRQHLGTVLIGSGKGNLPIPEAVSAWMRGLQHGLAGTHETSQKRLKRLTFVEMDPARVLKLHDALLKEAKMMRERLNIQYTHPEERTAPKKDVTDKACKQDESAPDKASSSHPTRVTLSLDRHTYRLGAITADASIPEREIPLDPVLVMQANDELAAEGDPQMQYERGRFLEKLLVPEDLRPQLATNAPLVMLLDSTTARIHWELVAQPDPLADVHRIQTAETERVFLGTCRGFTRQLRTTFAPPPEPPPPPRRVLRVLVVADPAEDAHLPGAEEEGAEVAELFERFNLVWQGFTDNRVEVVALLGPREATRTNVLRHLMLQTYDVLHFAGHCVYNDQESTASGWLFTDKQLLTTHELNRIDRIPKFVFSNACESGKTPDRSELRTTALAPSFAESFFGRGVANFVCTAWPVEDTMAREFAHSLYASLLAMKQEQTPNDQPKERTEEVTPAPPFTRDSPQQMHVAMMNARQRVARLPGGERMWGAYQHYGNPHFRFFETRTMRTQSAPADAKR